MKTRYEAHVTVNQAEHPVLHCESDIFMPIIQNSEFIKLQPRSINSSRQESDDQNQVINDDYCSWFIK